MGKLKKVMLILMLVVCWFTGCKKDPPSPGLLYGVSDGELEVLGKAEDFTFECEDVFVFSQDVIDACTEGDAIVKAAEAPELEIEDLTFGSDGGGITHAFEMPCDVNELYATTLDPNTSDLLWIIDESAMTYDVVIAVGDGEILFTTTDDGKMDIIFDANDCTANVAAFVDCMETMMPGYILSVAEKLTGEKNDK